jgi:hypothetical protein
MDKPTCASCVYWHYVADGSKGTPYGECRRSHPLKCHDFGKPGQHDVKVEAVITWGNYWCGEHQDFIKWMLDRPKAQEPEQQGCTAESASLEAHGTTESSASKSTPR